MSVRPRFVAALQILGAATVKPASEFLTVRHPGGGVAGRSARSGRGPVFLSALSSPQPAGSRTRAKVRAIRDGMVIV